MATMELNANERTVIYMALSTWIIRCQRTADEMQAFADDENMSAADRAQAQRNAIASQSLKEEAIKLKERF